MTVDASGRKWLTPKIPYDVFPDVPSDAEAAAATVAGERAPVTGMEATAVASTSRPAPEPSVEPSPSEASSGPASTDPPGVWGEVLPAEDLQSEIATVRNSLSEKLLTVGSYNDSFEAVSNDAWLMSALATIAQEHPAPISWKGNALLARDAAVALAGAAAARGRQNFNASQLAGEQLSAVLDNNTPPGLATPDPAASREETADRASLMQRMQAAFDRLKESGADAAALKKNAGVPHEARMLAALAKFTAHGDYTSAAEAEYQASAAELTSAGGAMAEAAGAEDFDGFRSALDRVGTACNKCHEKFRFGN